MTDNPLFTPSSLPHGVPPFDAIKEAHIEPAIRHAIDTARANVAAIKSNSALPDFDNTIVALDTAADQLKQISSLFYNQISAAGHDALEALTDVIGPLSANFASEIMLDPDIFARVRAVHDQIDHLSLTPEQTTLLKETYKGFVRNGALLGDNGKARIRAIDERLSVLAPQFQKNVKKSTESFELFLTDPTDLDGVPENARAAARDAAHDKGLVDSWLVTLHAPSFMPFITYATRRDLREKIWRAFNTRAYGDTFDNTEIIREILSLKSERAALLGYDSYADFTLAERMAGSSARVFEFLRDLIATYKPAAEKDLNDLRDYARRVDKLSDIQPWDVAFYREKLQQERFDFNSEELRPYFPLARVLEGTFTHFSKLFGVTFTANTTYPTWHPDVTTYDVTNTDDGAFVGILYADFFPRTGKQPGAWMTTYRDQGLLFGKIERPLVAIVCNFTKPTTDAPSLLTHDEVTTLFHEMGHAMHMMLSDCAYASLAGTNVKWDFVELPSQVQENWAYEPETLALISEHYQTGEPLPQDLIDKLNAAKQYMAGMNGLRQMAFSLLDMTWYSTDPAKIPHDLCAFEDQVMKDVTLFPRLAGPVSTSFGHIFGGGYAAGYYSYKWAEVLDADAFEYFKETGLYNAATAQAYRTHVLAKGGSEDPNILYARFRGRAPDPGALLRREGLADTA